VRGFWNLVKREDFTQKVIIHFEVQEISELLEMLKDQTEKDRKFLRTKSDGSFSDSNYFSETNLTFYRSIDGKFRGQGQKVKNMIISLKQKVNQLKPIAGLMIFRGESELSMTKRELDELRTDFNSIRDKINSLNENDFLDDSGPNIEEVD
jgi:hypothetical protein